MTVTPSATAGDVVDVAVALGGTADLYSSAVTLTYDPALLTYASGEVTSPEGGFGQVVPGEGTVTFVYSRLGTSPGIEGDVPVGTAQFTAAAAGTATVALSSVTVVGADGVGAGIAPEDLPSQAVVIEAAPTTPPVDPTDPPTDPTDPPTDPPTGPTDEPTDPPSDPTSTLPTTGPTDTATTDAPPAAGAATGGLASTGVALTGLAVAGTVFVVVGIVLARRRTVMSR
ncbi:hypothetical protein C8046_12505 [Serinibacter arcticus]|uniref:Cohesin domain-containing protein n=1 Tax=Serinibacter arcticus TaxID=1655435 RepID=A0A2U2A039_9MICO|nr:hypothetical protein C8046_12505 [Serinibacter arcticus]